MARDNHIIRPARPRKPQPKAPEPLTREQRIALMVQQVLGEVNARIDARPRADKSDKPKNR